MLDRHIILDTETTGLRTEDGHRIIEIGCLEMINRKLTGRHLHLYINPEREIDAAAQEIHGITNHFLQDKPTFKEVTTELMAFIEDSTLIIHNAPFDVGFINYELSLLRKGYKSLTEYCQIVDTLLLARKAHPGQKNHLDALCKRYGVDNSKREFHGALLDANLLAHVYLAMTGGQGSFLIDVMDINTEVKTAAVNPTKALESNSYALHILSATEEEELLHEEYLQSLKRDGHCLWLEE